MDGSPEAALSVCCAAVLKILMLLGVVLVLHYLDDLPLRPQQAYAEVPPLVLEALCLPPINYSIMKLCFLRCTNLHSSAFR